MIVLFLLFGVIFGLLGGLMAFLITWNEWQKHKFKGKKLFKESFKTGLFTFMVFVIISLIAGYVISAGLGAK